MDKSTEIGTVQGVILSRMASQQILRCRTCNQGTKHFSVHPRNGIRPTLFTLGDGDLRGVFLPQLAPYDYPIPAVSAKRQPRSVASLTPLTFEDVRPHAAALFERYFEGLQVLRRMGMSKLAVLSIPPPGLDDDAFETQNGYRAARDSHYKAVLLFNAILKENCSDFGIAFIDIWDEVTGPDGYLNPDFYLDGTHLNEAGGAIAVSKLLSAFG